MRLAVACRDSAVLYFAYGSNMDGEQMRARCSSARFVARAVLPGHQLRFPRKSIRRNCGVADVEPAVGHEVWGVVYEVSEIDLGRLDRYEDYQPGGQRNAYWRRECRVFVDNDERKPLKCSAYFAEPQPEPPLPSRAYVGHLLDGAYHWHLPKEYIARLEAIETDG